MRSFVEKPHGDGALDQRRLLRPLARGARLHRGRRTRSGSASRWSGSPPRASSRAFLHRGFWQPMDTLRDKTLLEELWQSGKAPWKIVGHESRVLAGPARPRHRPHRLQGRLAVAVAAGARARR